ncbi:MAG: phospholipase D family protein [Gammaproteobacteria bacterium]|nr:phospholipase D family protein [Gammaproteobacteria bacterium]
MFLDNSNYLDCVKSYFDNKEALDISVPFWGKGALSLFESISENKKIRIICNLESGACNPYEIEKISKRYNVSIRSSDRLHAKLFLQDSSMIIGSANVSSNGLSFEGDESDGWFEAGVELKDRKVLDDASRWFDKLWGESSQIDLYNINKFKVLWDKRRNNRPFYKVKGAQSLFDAARGDLEQFKDRKIYFVVYVGEDFSKEAFSAFETGLGEDMGQDTVSFFEYESEVGDSIPGDAVLINIQCGPRGGIKCIQIGSTLDEKKIKCFQYENGADGVVIYYFLEDVGEFDLSSEDKDFIKIKFKNSLWGEFFNKGNYSEKGGYCVVPFYKAMDVMFREDD